MAGPSLQTQSLFRHGLRISCVILFGILLPLIWYNCVKSIDLYVAAVKLSDEMENLVNATSWLVTRENRHRAGHGHDHPSKSNVLEGVIRTYSNIEPIKTTKNYPKESVIEDKIITKSRFQQVTPAPYNSIKTTKLLLQSSHPSTARPLTCEGCFLPKINFVLNNKNICKFGDVVKVLVLITSAPHHLPQRNAIRSTWLSEIIGNTRSIRYVFLIGNSVENQEIERENNITHDIVLGDFMDTYQNLTWKTMMGFRWTKTFCNMTKFVLKTDDDMYVNLPGLERKVQDYGQALQMAVGGYCYKVGMPIRSRTSKWYASVRSYPQKTYPGFCSGTGYIMSFNVVSKIVDISRHVPFFHLEDVYVSLCIKQLGFKLLNLEGFLLQYEYDSCKYKDVSLVTAHQVSPKWLKFIWENQCKVENKTDIISN